MGLFDRFRRADNLPGDPTEELTASVHRVDLNKTLAAPGGAKPGKAQAWQQEAWDRFQDVGELSAVCQWFSNSLSRVRLVASDIDDSTGQPTDKSTDQAARDMVRDIAGGPAGQASMLARMATFLTVPGESWVAIVTRRDTGDTDLDGTEEWHVVGDTEINGVGQEIELTLPDDTKHLLDPETDSLFRVHRPHPRRSADAYSPVLAALPVLREIRRADQTIEAAGKSRVAGNGVLVVPNQLSMPTGVAPTGGNPDAPGLPDQEPTAPGMVRTNASHLMGSLQHVMSTAIADPSSAAGMVPIVLQGDGEWIDKIKHLTLDTEITETNLKVRQDAIRRLALSMDVPPEVLLGNSDSNHWCKTDDHEILTRWNGWVTHDKLSIGDEVLTLNHDTGRSEWNRVESIYRAHVEAERMTQFESRTFSSISTDGHRWPTVRVNKRGETVRGWTTTGDGFTASARIPARAELNGARDETTPDAMVRLAAAYTSDGTVLRYKSGTPYIRIAKFDPTEIDTLRDVLDEAGFSPTEHFHPTRSRDGVSFVLGAEESKRLLDITGDDKALTAEFLDALSTRQCRVFLDAMIEIGDGCVRGHRRTFFQSSQARLDAIERCATIAGFKTLRGVREHNTGFSDGPLYWVAVTDAIGTVSPRNATATAVEYTGTIWCPTTANGTWFCRRDGKSYFTGNSAWASRDEAIGQHIAPMMTLICEALTDAVLRPLLESQGHPNPESVCVWFDLSNLSRRPDRRDEATAAFDRGVISASSYRAELGYGDDDAPGTDSEEARREQALRMVNQAPSLFPYLAHVLGFELPPGLVDGGARSADPDLPESVSIPRDSPRSSNPLPSSDPTEEDE